jgi:hypothetical protein
MTDLDPQIATMLDRLLPTPHEAGDWGRVVADAGTIPQPRRGRLALAFVAAAALAAALALVPALAGQGYFWFLGAEAPKPVTDVVTVTTATDRSGVPWQLTAYQSEDKGLCFQLTSASGRSGAATCGPRMPIAIAWMVASPGASSGTFILGPVTADARRVEIAGPTGRVEASVTPAPQALNAHIGFYIALLPPRLSHGSLIVEALDEQGQVIASDSTSARAVDPPTRP